jgi:hypothetical protein
VKEVDMTVITTNPPAPTPRKARQPLAARRFAYLMAALVDAAILYAVNVRPGWDVLPFLTKDTEQVLPWVNASIVVGLVANVLYVVRDPQWFRALGEMVTTAFSVAAMLRIWDVFPLHFDEGGFDWELLARVLLGLGIVGTVIAFVVALVAFVRALANR